MHISEPRPITVEDKDYIDSFRNTHDNKLTALSFQSVYTWKDFLGLSVTGNDKFCSVFSRRDNGYFCPMGDKDACNEFIDSLIEREKNFKIMYLSQSQAYEYKLEKNAEIHKNPDLSEYIYLSDALALKQGASANYKRRLKKFRSMYDYTVSEIKPGDIPQLADKLTEACDEESSITANILKTYDKLGFTGVILNNGGNYAFVIGYENTEDIFTMSVVHTSEEWQSIAVAVCEYELAGIVRDRYKYIDLEEDLGIAGLRRIKQLTKPVKMLDAFEANFNFQ